MSYRGIFTRPHTFITAVHAEDEMQVLRNVGIAHESGADGVFLINHSIPAEELLEIYRVARAHFCGFWIGLNLLDRTAPQALECIPSGCAGLWTDYAGIQDRGAGPETAEFDALRTRLGWDGLYFGGVAFKHQAHVHDPASAARIAASHMDVVTTSGIATGSAPAVEKIKYMKREIGKHPLAVASGISVENIETFKRWADCFIVASSISDSHTKLNRDRARELADAIHA